METLIRWWWRLRRRINDHLHGPYYRERWECTHAQRQKEAEQWSKVMEEKDALIYSLKQQQEAAIELIISRWVKEYLQDENYWRRLFERVLAQPTGQRLWVEALYKQLDNLSEEQRLELFYNYLESRGGKIKIQFNKA
jgi:hypothetical protein